LFHRFSCFSVNFFANIVIIFNSHGQILQKCIKIFFISEFEIYIPKFATYIPKSAIYIPKFAIKKCLMEEDICYTMKKNLIR